MSRTLIQKTKKLLASELGTCYGTGGGLVSFALAYPNTYYVGMSNLGFQTVYKILNELPEVVCERVFLPDWEDQKEYRRTNTKLFALESQRPVKDFDILGFSISYELDYLNILKILDFSNIPLRSQERKETEPLIIAGGPCATFNPEPLADFIDAFVIGEAEEVLPEIIEVVKPARRTTIAGGSEKCKEKREEILKALGQIEGVYVPSLYQVEYNQDGTIKSIRPKNGAAPPRIKKRWVKNLDEFETHSVILTPNTEFKNMFLIELTRGCRHLCRFCLAGYCYLPPRARSLENILPLIDRGSELTNKIGLVGAA
ncbi:MAG: B12-binding domain-containing radical SAM protein, partial [candidate division WOR-3 bacterium]